MTAGAGALPHRAYAGLVSRVGALVVDVGLLTLATLAVGSLPGLAWEQVVATPAPAWWTGGAAIVAAVLPWAYFTCLWWLTGQTVGGLLAGIVVRHRDGGGVSFIQAALRAAVGLVLAPVWLIGLISVLSDDRRRAWHDRVFRTVVRYVTRIT